MRSDRQPREEKPCNRGESGAVCEGRHRDRDRQQDHEVMEDGQFVHAEDRSLPLPCRAEVARLHQIHGGQLRGSFELVNSLLLERHTAHQLFETVLCQDSALLKRALHDNDA